MVFTVAVIVGYVMGVTQLHDVVYVVSVASSTILRFNATTYERLEDINSKGLIQPHAVAACERTSQLYVADCEEYVWRVSADGADIKRLLPKSSSHMFSPWSLSVTSTRLLVTSLAAEELLQFDADGDELRRVQLPDYMEPRHAVELPTGTFIVSHEERQRGQISEVNTDGEVLRQFSGSRLLSLGSTHQIAVDSHGNIFAADFDNRHILLLDAQLTLRRIILDEHQLNYKKPRCLCYTERSGQLLVGFMDSIAVSDVLRR